MYNKNLEYLCFNRSDARKKDADSSLVGEDSIYIQSEKVK
jgi:hypothetical protein